MRLPLSFRSSKQKQGNRINPKIASNKKKLTPLSGRYLPLDMEGESVR
jgi:hypothetical protein